MRRLTALLSVIALATGLLTPKMGAAVAELFPGTLRVVVICTGMAMQTIVIDSRGDIVDITETDPCVASDLPKAADPIPAWHRLQLGWQPDTIAAHLGPVSAPLDHRPPGRGPPHSV
ncbi:MAG: hypothetical protein AAF366_19030 [Pseudomonadota bacterium]